MLKATRLQCDMSHDCHAPVTHIDNKGFVYCREHGIDRKDYARCRQLTKRELATLRTGQAIHYEPARNLPAAHMRDALIQAIEESGYSVSGPTDHRVAEHGEPHWVCNARAAIAKG